MHWTLIWTSWCIEEDFCIGFTFRSLHSVLLSHTTAVLLTRGGRNPEIYCLELFWDLKYKKVKLLNRSDDKKVCAWTLWKSNSQWGHFLVLSQTQTQLSHRPSGMLSWTMPSSAKNQENNRSLPSDSRASLFKKSNHFDTKYFWTVECSKNKTQFNSKCGFSSKFHHILAWESWYIYCIGAITESMLQPRPECSIPAPTIVSF